MNTIFEKIDPKYLECVTGSCEHVLHTNNMYIWFLVVAISLYSVKYYHANYKKN